MTIYISGGITNNPDYINDFANAEQEVKNNFPAARIINPARLNSVLPKLEWKEYMIVCIDLLEISDAIYMVSGWKDSAGACVEYGYALGKDKVIINA